MSSVASSTSLMLQHQAGCLMLPAPAGGAQEEGRQVVFTCSLPLLPIRPASCFDSSEVLVRWKERALSDLLLMGMGASRREKPEVLHLAGVLGDNK